MARDKAKDDKYYNCSENHEKNYVASLYKDKDKVKALLDKLCGNGIKNSTHTDVYKLINKKLGHPIPK